MSRKRRKNQSLYAVTPFLVLAAVATGVGVSKVLEHEIEPPTDEALSPEVVARNETAPPPKPSKVEWTYKLPERFRGITISSVKPRNGAKMVALTFDDGPWPIYTNQVLDILKRENVKATFFVIGRQVAPYRSLIQRIHNEGHQLGNHTWNHKYRMTAEQVVFEMDSTDRAIKEVIGKTPPYFRPPGGFLNNGLAARAKGRGNVVVMWSTAVNDTAKNSSADTIYNAAIRAQNGGILLLHDGGGNRKSTVTALPRIIAHFKKNGYKMVTLEELLENSDPVTRSGK